MLFEYLLSQHGALDFRIVLNRKSHRVSAHERQASACAEKERGSGKIEATPNATYWLKVRKISSRHGNFVFIFFKLAPTPPICICKMSVLSRLSTGCRLNRRPSVPSFLLSHWLQR